MHHASLGFLHIVPKGADHVVFVLGLFFAGGPLRRLVWQLTSFTLAHSLTLGWLRVPPSIVERLIALSIVYVAAENILLKAPSQQRNAVVFAFGLLHGLGFAGVLQELGLPQERFVLALLAFNTGVETGQLAVLAGAALAVGWWRGRSWYARRIGQPASVAIALLGACWVVDRVLL